MPGHWKCGGLRVLLCVLVGPAGLAGCGEIHTRAAGPPPAAETAADAAYLLSSLETLHQREIDDAEAAKGRVTHPQVKAYIAHVAEDHAGMLARSRAVRQEAMLPDQAAVSAAAASTWTSATGPAADVAYLDHSVRLHEDALQMMDQSTPERDSPVKRYLQRSRIMIETHRAIMLDLQKMLFMTRYFSADIVPAAATSAPPKPGKNGTHPSK